MATAKKLPSGSWRVNLYIGKDDKGKRIYKSFTADTKKEAEFLAASYNLKRKETPKDITVGDAIDGYIASKENVLSPTTIGGYKELRRNKLQAIMNIPLSKIDNITIQSTINREATRLSPKTLRNAHGLLSAALAMYLPDFTLHTTLPAKQHKIKDLPTPEQVISAVSGTDIELPVLMAIWLGLRMSEVRGVRYKDIVDGVLTVQNVRIKYGNQVIEKQQTKTYNSTRQLVVPPYLLDMIGIGDSNEYVIQIAACTLTKKLKRIVYQETGKYITFHDLRHINASVMLSLGIPDKYAMERGGWASNNTLKSVYQHTFSNERQDMDTRIDDYFYRIVQHEMQHNN